MAARYVHQLAEEVLSMLSGIAGELQMHQEMSKIAKQRFEEWDKSFPTVLKEIGGPDDIANYLLEKEEENDRLRSELCAEREKKDQDLQNVMRSMDYQLHASRNGALSERQQLTQDFRSMAEQLEKDMRVRETKHNQEVTNLHDQYTAEIKALRETYEVRVICSCRLELIFV
jgi:hypothetical protein